MKLAENPLYKHSANFISNFIEEGVGTSSAPATFY